MHEKMKKRIALREPPNGSALRTAMRLAHEHLDYIDWLIDTRRWLGGAQLSLADFAAAAQISVVDYLGGIDWQGHEEAHGWYRVMKSRPSFRPLLAEKMDGVPPSGNYADVNA
jgi:glutathione S-transferase